MHNPNLHAALARLDVMDETIAALRFLVSAYDEDGEDGSHIAKYLSAAVGGAAADLARLAEARLVEHA